MRWYFSDANTLVEKESGYKIHLMSGTWFHPGQLKPEAPKSMDFSQQIHYLRTGLQHIRSIGTARKAG